MVVVEGGGIIFGGGAWWHLATCEEQNVQKNTLLTILLQCVEKENRSKCNLAIEIMI